MKNEKLLFYFCIFQDEITRPISWHNPISVFSVTRPTTSLQVAASPTLGFGFPCKFWKGFGFRVFLCSIFIHRLVSVRDFPLFPFCCAARKQVWCVLPI
ncbi:hypothetical protein L6164_022799 [Bauhinia variegata]|uniref:Uncharacterized protein n=1 Tax=Bauhinia variegata TaxID=167791 RepID=A0ACB9MHL2_BAUVA|nr:hypothetical protein L6164_022799 [Bauhinia variegata]